MAPRSRILSSDADTRNKHNSDRVCNLADDLWLTQLPLGPAMDALMLTVSARG
jgi:hypothetical protein